MKGKVTTMPEVEEVFPNPIDLHMADSHWQTCNCRTCQHKRKFLDGLPGVRIDYNTFRLAGERY
jgi:hypothetical protein